MAVHNYEPESSQGNNATNRDAAQGSGTEGNTRSGGATNEGGASQAPQKAKRGFAAMDKEKQRQIASKGGKTAHAKGTAHQFTPEEAREAGRKGGIAAHEQGTAHEFTPEEAREAGRKGGRARGLKKLQAQQAQQDGSSTSGQTGGGSEEGRSSGNDVGITS